MFCILLITVLSVDESLFNKLSIYEIMISSFQDGNPNLGYGIGYGPSHFQGDLQGIINSLEYIKDLGINTIWITPPFDSTNGQGGEVLQSCGYFATNYFKVDPKFGDEETLRKLIQKAHSYGIYVLFDAVLGHHGGVTTPSPSGHLPYGPASYSKYPESLPFYTEFVTYWIENYEIDGWRLDQCGQLNQNGHNYMKEIREAVYKVCDKRRAEGKQWGILGYVVGEDWDGVDGINEKTYSGDGLKSAFDFNSRYYMVQGAAQEENGLGGLGIRTFSNAHRTAEEKGYLSGVYPALFVSNHDTWRLGNLIRQKYNEDVDNERYWARHRMVIGALSIYSGPISFYYGDEIGAITDCWHGNRKDCGDTTFSDNCARTDGQIKDLNKNQQDLHDFTKKLLHERQKHPAMYNGTYGRYFEGNAYINLKYDFMTKDKVLYITTLENVSKVVYYDARGTKMVDLINGEVIKREKGTYAINLQPFETRVFNVIDDEQPNNDLIQKQNAKYVDKYDSSSITTEKTKTKSHAGVIAGSICLAVVVVVAIGITIYIRNQKKNELSSIDDNDPLLTENNGYVDPNPK